MEFEAIAGALGAEVTGVDLTGPLNATAHAELRAALATYQVLFFRDQRMSAQNHRALAHVFGETQPHPAYPTVDGYPELSILEITADAPPKIDTWHTDMTFMERPPLGSILHGKIIPAAGGDTLFASLGSAFDTLSEATRRMVDGLVAEHSFAYGFRHSLAESDGQERLAAAVRANPPRPHPVVRRHPVTGRRVLFVNPLFTTHIVGMGESESRALLERLYDHIKTPEHTCRFRWRSESVAIWDNRATWHRPINDFWPGVRRMQRITIAGDVPK